MQKIGFVIPWYGENDPVGIEMELHELAAHLQRAGTEIEILTTCIKSFHSNWNENYYAAGTALVDDILVRRFPIDLQNLAAFEQIQKKMHAGQHLNLHEERRYIEEAINSPQLYEYLMAAQQEYDFYVFMPYGFGTTYFGMQSVPEKSILIPCFQDEPALYLRLFRQAYVQARGMIYHTIPEMEQAGKVYDFSTTAQICMGAGVDTNVQADGAHFRQAYQITEPFLLYVGQKDCTKNLPLLLRYFTEYKHRQPNSPLQLVLIGLGTADIPVSIQDTVYDLGFVTEQDKYDAMAASLALCQPSEKERFAPVLMESWLSGRPVLVSAKCAVTRDFARRFNGGLYYRDYFEFEGSVQYLMAHPEIAAQLGENGKQMVQEQFNWDKIVQKYLAFFEKLRKE